MRRRSSADRRPAGRGERAGFTLMEAMVSLIILVIVMVVVLSLLFSMKSFAEKQQAYTAPRQTARRALDYVAQTLEGAADWNQITATTAQPTPGNPYALVMLYEWGTSAASSARQASYNNLTSAQATAGFGTEGTDIISVAYPAAQSSPAKIPISRWDDNGPSGVDIYLDYAAGCGVDVNDPYNAGNASNIDNVGNLKAFQRTVGGPWTEPTGGAVVSSLVIIADGNGSWRLAQLTGLDPTNSNTLTTLSSDCTKKRALSPASSAGQVIKATLKDASAVSQYLAPRAPGAASGWRTDILKDSSFLIAGIDFVSFRHRTVPDPTDAAGNRQVGRLEQKSSGINPATGVYTPGFFDPVLDRPGSSFTPIVDNVDDFQVAYVLTDGSIWNTATQTFDNGATKIPLQAQSPGAGGVNCRTTGALLTGGNLDAACVVGLRVSIVGRSLPMSLGSRKLTGAGMVTQSGDLRSRRLPVEDHTVPATTPLDSLDMGIYDRLRLTTTLMLRNRALGF